MVFCRCGSTGCPTHPVACWGRKQAAVLSSHNSQFGTTTPAVHCLCGRERQSRLPRVNTTALHALSRAAQHECLTVWIHHNIKCYISLVNFKVAAPTLIMHSPSCFSRLPFWKLRASVDSGAKIERELRTFSNRLKRHHLGEGVISLDEHSTSLLSNMVCVSFIQYCYIDSGLNETVVIKTQYKYKQLDAALHFNCPYFIFSPLVSYVIAKQL